MILIEAILAAVLIDVVQSTPQRPVEQPPPAPPSAIDCAVRVGSAVGRAVQSYCQGEQELRLAEAAARDAPERPQHLRTAIGHYRRAVSLAADDETKMQALSRLALAYDRQHLDEPDREEPVLRELIALAPQDVQPIFRLAALQEARGFIDAAEATLLSARTQRPDQVEPYQELAKFYARRVTALRLAKLKEGESPSVPVAADQPDESGVYRIGGSIKPPTRVTNVAPQYPPDAQAAKIQGVVIAEIVVDETGRVADARVLRSIPLLDEAALASVKQWRYEPTVVDGKPVPVRMTVTVNFTQQK